MYFCWCLSHFPLPVMSEVFHKPGKNKNNNVVFYEIKTQDHPYICFMTCISI